MLFPEFFHLFRVNDYQGRRPSLVEVDVNILRIEYADEPGLADARFELHYTCPLLPCNTKSLIVRTYYKLNGDFHLTDVASSNILSADLDNGCSTLPLSTFIDEIESLVTLALMLIGDTYSWYQGLQSRCYQPGWYLSNVYVTFPPGLRSLTEIPVRSDLLNLSFQDFWNHSVSGVNVNRVMMRDLLLARWQSLVSYNVNTAPGTKTVNTVNGAMRFITIHIVWAGNPIPITSTLVKVL